MKKPLVLLLIIAILLFLNLSFFSDRVSAGEAGVGVINVPPKFGYIRVEQQDDLIRVYLTISDYNSWEDINEVIVTLDAQGINISKFIFKQYENIDSYIEINEFSEIPEESRLLVKEKCFYEKSSNKETINERCDIKIRFVFHKTWFTGVRITINDIEGLNPAEAYINYNTEDTMRSSNNIVIPFVGNTIIIGIPSFLTDLIAIITATIGTIYYFKKNYTKIRFLDEKI